MPVVVNTDSTLSQAASRLTLKASLKKAPLPPKRTSSFKDQTSGGPYDPRSQLSDDWYVMDGVTLTDSVDFTNVTNESLSDLQRSRSSSDDLLSSTPASQSRNGSLERILEHCNNAAQSSSSPRGKSRERCHSAQSPEEPPPQLNIFDAALPPPPPSLLEDPVGIDIPPRSAGYLRAGVPPQFVPAFPDQQALNQLRHGLKKTTTKTSSSNLKSKEENIDSGNSSPGALGLTSVRKVISGYGTVPRGSAGAGSRATHEEDTTLQPLSGQRRMIGDLTDVRSDQETAGRLSESCSNLDSMVLHMPTPEVRRKVEEWQAGVERSMAGMGAEDEHVEVEDESGKLVPILVNRRTNRAASLATDITAKSSVERSFEVFPRRPCAHQQEQQQQQISSSAKDSSSSDITVISCSKYVIDRPSVSGVETTVKPSEQKLLKTDISAPHRPIAPPPHCSGGRAVKGETLSSDKGVVGENYVHPVMRHFEQNTVNKNSPKFGRPFAQSMFVKDVVSLSSAADVASLSNLSQPAAGVLTKQVKQTGVSGGSGGRESPKPSMWKWSKSKSQTMPETSSGDTVTATATSSTSPVESGSNIHEVGSPSGPPPGGRRVLPSVSTNPPPPPVKLSVGSTSPPPQSSHISTKDEGSSPEDMKSSISRPGAKPRKNKDSQSKIFGNFFSASPSKKSDSAKNKDANSVAKELLVSKEISKTTAAGQVRFSKDAPTVVADPSNTAPSGPKPVLRGFNPALSGTNAPVMLLSTSEQLSARRSLHHVGYSADKDKEDEGAEEGVTKEAVAELTASLSKSLDVLNACENKQTSNFLVLSDQVQAFRRACSRYVESLPPHGKFQFREMLSMLATVEEGLKTGNVREYDKILVTLQSSLKGIEAALKR